jgi:hypothetical protein
MPYRAFTPLVFVVLSLGAGFAQTSNKPSTADPKRTIRIGIAVPINRSNRQITPAWERDQLVRELQRLHADRKSTIVLEAVALDATGHDEAIAEAEIKGCEYFVISTLLNPSRGPGKSGGPDGSQRAPVVIGNGNVSRMMAMDFTIFEVGTARTVAEGTATAPVEGNKDTRAADDTMRFVAHRVASELRSSHPPGFE